MDKKQIDELQHRGDITKGLAAILANKSYIDPIAKMDNITKQIGTGKDNIRVIENYLTDVVILKDAGVLIEDTLDNIQANSHLVKNARLENKNIIKETTFGSSVEQTIYDDLSNEEIQRIRNQGGEVESLDLQMFVAR